MARRLATRLWRGRGRHRAARPLPETVGPPPNEVGQDDLGRRVGTSAMWSATNTAVLRLATFAVSLLIAHLVAPYEFGVFTVALTVYNIVISISELGVASAIVRESERTPEIAPTVFTISIGTSAVLTLFMVGTAPIIAQELGAPRATSAIRVLSLVVLLASFSQVPAAILSRDFMQRQRFVADAAFFVSSTVVLVILLALGNDVMALAFSRVAGQLVTVLVIMWLSPERYRPGFALPAAKHLLSFGLPLAGSNLIALGIANVDFIIVGRILHAQSLGLYNLAFGISGWPVTIFSAVLISVTLPTLSRVRDSPVELARHLRAGLSAVVAASFPVCALLIALAPPLIDVVYGRRWHEAWTALVVLAIFGAARTVLTLFTDLTVALGRTRSLFGIQLAWLLTLVPALVFGVERWGIAGAGIAHATVVTVVVIPLYLWTISRRTSVSLDWIPGSILVPLVASVAAGFAAYATVRIVHGEVWELLSGAAVGCVVYVLIGAHWLRGLIRRLRSMYWSKGSPPFAPVGAGVGTVQIGDLPPEGIAR